MIVHFCRAKANLREQSWIFKLNLRERHSVLGNGVYLYQHVAAVDVDESERVEVDSGEGMKYFHNHFGRQEKQSLAGDEASRGVLQKTRRKARRSSIVLSIWEHDTE